jgi:hypothetical protein
MPQKNHPETLEMCQQSWGYNPFLSICDDNHPYSQVSLSLGFKNYLHLREKIEEYLSTRFKHNRM